MSGKRFWKIRGLDYWILINIEKNSHQSWPIFLIFPRQKNLKNALKISKIPTIFIFNLKKNHCESQMKNMMKSDLYDQDIIRTMGWKKILILKALFTHHFAESDMEKYCIRFLQRMEKFTKIVIFRFPKRNIHIKKASFHFWSTILDIRRFANMSMGNGKKFDILMNI